MIFTSKVENKSSVFFDGNGNGNETGGGGGASSSSGGGASSSQIVVSFPEMKEVEVAVMVSSQHLSLSSLSFFF